MVTSIVLNSDMQRRAQI